MTLHLRLPDAFAEHGIYLVLPGIRFTYGHVAIVQAPQSSRRITALTKAGKPTVKRTGSALSYRFVRDERSWRMMVSVVVPPVSHKALGAIGVDVNSEHLGRLRSRPLRQSDPFQAH